MDLRRRYIHESVQEDLLSRMVFVGGPRQVGKTTFALSFLTEPAASHPAYLNWDEVSDRKAILRGELPPKQNLIILDEIHKFARWRSLVKGFFDTRRSETAFIVTGSARLDYYSKGGDSLQGRYHHYRLHPFSLMELNAEPTKADFESMLRYGGFPEPCLKADDKFWRRWQRERLHRVIYDDIRNLESVKEISLLELLAEELPHRVGAPLSVRNLKETLQVAHETVDRWIKIFERMYYCFRIPPYGSRRVRAVKKEQKLYLWDWSLVPEPGPRFENFMAAQLLKYCHLLEDTEGYRMDLRFLRDTDKREIDFVVIRENKPVFAVECKTADRDVSPALHYFKDRTPIPDFFQVHTGNKDYEKNGIRVIPVQAFCKEHKLP
jgi:hypothetical protein